jgi:hypothetical protein
MRTGYHRHGFEIPNNLPEEDKYTKYLPDDADRGFYVAGILFQSFCSKVLHGTVYSVQCTVYSVQYYTVQYPGSSTEIPT